MRQIQEGRKIWKEPFTEGYVCAEGGITVLVAVQNLVDEWISSGRHNYMDSCFISIRLMILTRVSVW